jgi:hypothetical protein
MRTGKNRVHCHVSQSVFRSQYPGIIKLIVFIIVQTSFSNNCSCWQYVLNAMTYRISVKHVWVGWCRIAWFDSAGISWSPSLLCETQGSSASEGCWHLDYTILFTARVLSSAKLGLVRGTVIFTHLKVSGRFDCHCRKTALKPCFLRTGQFLTAETSIVYLI